MNIYSKDYNIYLSRTENIVPSNPERNYVLQDCLWNLFVETIHNVEIWSAR